MRYLRMLVNALAAAALATAYVLVLVVLLNPRQSLQLTRIHALAASIAPFYLAVFTAIFVTVLGAWQLFAPRAVAPPFISGGRLSPAWVSVGVLAWLGALAAAASALLMWANLRTYGVVLPPPTVQALESAAAVLAVAAALFVVIGLARRRGGMRARLVWGCSVLAVAAGSVVAPLAMRGDAPDLGPERGRVSAVVDASGELPSPDVVGPHVTLIAIDAGSLDLIMQAAAEGRLPNFGRILDAGAVSHLATLHPTSAEAVWTTVATGKLPQKNGVRSAGVYRPVRGGDPLRLLPDFCFANGLIRFGLLVEEPHASTSIGARTLWGILSAEGLSSGIVNWPLTYPAPPLRGYVISQLYVASALSTAGLGDREMIYPPHLHDLLLPRLQAAALEPAPIEPAIPLGAIPDRYRAAARIDRLHETLIEALENALPTALTAVRYQSLDPVGHYFLRYTIPSQFGDVTEEEQRRFGSVLEGHYAMIDEAVGKAIGALGPDDLLLVVSGYGMEPLTPGKRLLEALFGDPAISGSHEAAPEGFWMAYGAAVRPGRLTTRASVVDVVPTVLYFLGLPIGRDMDGYARTDIFQPDFTSERPITFIPTYEE